jgi:hypothetical protein
VALLDRPVRHACPGRPSDGQVQADWPAIPGFRGPDWTSCTARPSRRAGSQPPDGAGQLPGCRRPMRPTGRREASTVSASTALAARRTGPATRRNTPRPPDARGSWTRNSRGQVSPVPCSRERSSKAPTGPAAYGGTVRRRATCRASSAGRAPFAAMDVSSMAAPACDVECDRRAAQGRPPFEPGARLTVTPRRTGTRTGRRGPLRRENHGGRDRVMSPAQVGEAHGLVESARSYMTWCAVRTRLPIAPGRATLCRHHPGSGSASRAGRVDSRRTTAESALGWLGASDPAFSAVAASSCCTCTSTGRRR